MHDFSPGSVSLTTLHSNQLFLSFGAAPIKIRSRDSCSSTIGTSCAGCWSRWHHGRSLWRMFCVTCSRSASVNVTLHGLPMGERQRSTITLLYQRPCQGNLNEGAFFWWPRVYLLQELHAFLQLLGQNYYHLCNASAL